MKIDQISGHDKRRRRYESWDGILIHHTGVGGRKEISESLWSRLYKNLTEYLGRKDGKYVSAHFTVGRQGEVTQIIDPHKYEAFHAGVSEYFIPKYRKVINDLNGRFIGIELIGDGNLHRYSKEQYQALAKLCQKLMKDFPEIHPVCIVGHEHVAPKRKWDPGKYFDWKLFFTKLYRA